MIAFSAPCLLLIDEDKIISLFGQVWQCFSSAMSSLSVFSARKHVAHFTPPRGCLEHFLCRYSSVDLPVLVVTID
jgi:hypothetical protein